MNCPKCNEENDMDCESKCWKCGEKFEGSGVTPCSHGARDAATIKGPPPIPFILHPHHAARAAVEWGWVEGVNYVVTRPLQENPQDKD